MHKLVSTIHPLAGRLPLWTFHYHLMGCITEWLTELCLQYITHNSPLLDDLPPGIRRIDKVSQVVISYNDPVCFFCEVEQEPE